MIVVPPADDWPPSVSSPGVQAASDNIITALVSTTVFLNEIFIVFSLLRVELLRRIKLLFRRRQSDRAHELTAEDQQQEQHGECLEYCGGHQARPVGPR